jgi:hypothetical protein
MIDPARFVSANGGVDDFLVVIEPEIICLHIVLVVGNRRPQNAAASILDDSRALADRSGGKNTAPVDARFLYHDAKHAPPAVLASCRSWHKEELEIKKEKAKNATKGGAQQSSIAVQTVDYADGTDSDQRRRGRAMGEDFFGGAAGEFPRKFFPEQDIRYRRLLFRANRVVERFIQPKKTFLGLDLYSTTSPGRSCADFIIRHHDVSPPCQIYFESRVRAGRMRKGRIKKQNHAAVRRTKSRVHY